MKEGKMSIPLKLWFFHQNQDGKLWYNQKLYFGLKMVTEQNLEEIDMVTFLLCMHKIQISSLTHYRIYYLLIDFPNDTFGFREWSHTILKDKMWNERSSSKKLKQVEHESARTIEICFWRILERTSAYLYILSLTDTYWQVLTCTDKYIEMKYD